MPAPGRFIEALLLRSVDYGDADRIVTFLTVGLGKAAFIARGARRSQKRFGGSLSPFAVIRAEVREGRGSLGTLSQAQVIRAFPRVLGDLERMAAGFSALEVLREVTREEEPLERVFATAVALLEALDAEDAQPQPLLVCFLARLMGLSGFAPRLDACGECGKRPEPEQSGMFDPRRGHLVCRACGGATQTLSGRVRALLAQAASNDFRPPAAERWSPRELSSARDAMRSFVEHRIGKRLTADLLTPAAAVADSSDSMRSPDSTDPDTTDPDTTDPDTTDPDTTDPDSSAKLRSVPE